MKPHLSLVVSIATVLALLSLLETRTTAQIPRPKGDSTVHVKAIYEDTERPVRRAPVQLFLEGKPGFWRTGVTDARGEFTFKNVPAGQYRVAVGFPGMTNGGLSAPQREAAVLIDVGGTSSADVKLRAARPGAITGKVTYPDGEPAVGAQVSVVKKSGKRWENVALVSSGAQTDDRGVYRIHPLSEGEYVVSVIEQSIVIEESEYGMRQTTGNQSLNPYYYGGGSHFATATLIQVDTGREVNNINIALTERATYKITGSIVAGGGRAPDVSLRLQPDDQGLSGPSLMVPHGPTARSNKEGQWSFTDVPDGTYSIDMDFMQGWGPDQTRGKPRLVAQRQLVTVGGADVSGIVISLAEGARVSGTIVVEGDKPLPKNGQVSLEPVDRRTQFYTGGMQRGGEWSKGQFYADGLAAGEHLVRVRVYDGNYFVKAITWNERDLLRQPLKVAEGEEIKDVRIVLSRDVGKVFGRFVSEEGKKPLASAWYMLVPSDQTKWNREEFFIRGFTDNLGAFKATGAPGEYIVVTQTPTVEPSSLSEFLREQATGPRVTLSPDERSEVEIVVPVKQKVG